MVFATSIIGQFNGTDRHKLTASLIFNKPLEQVTKEEQYIAKSFNFGLSSGMGAGDLQANLRENGIEIDKERAGEYIRAFFKSYSQGERIPGPCRYLYSRALLYQEQRHMLVLPKNLLHCHIMFINCE